MSETSSVNADATGAVRIVTAGCNLPKTAV